MKITLPKIEFGSTYKEQSFDPPGVVPAWLVRMADLTSWILIAALMYFLFLWTLEISGDRATPLLISKAGIWELNTAFYWPLLIGFLGSAIGLPLLAKIGIPIFCELSFKKPGQGWPKFWMLILIILTSLVIIAGNMHVINGARLEKNREGAVKVELNDQARGALQANLDAINQDLADITNPALTTYQAQSAREGAAAWAKRVATAKAQNDYQADAIERAMASAERGDQLRKDRKAAMLALAGAPTQAAAAERIVTQGDWVTSLVDEIDRVRAVMLGAVQDLAALLLGWIAYRLAAVRKQQLADWEAVHAEPHAEPGVDLRITDGTDQWQPVPNETTYDPDTGEELIPVRRRKEVHYRRKPKSKKDDAQAPIGASDPRASAANQLGSEELETMGADDGIRSELAADAGLDDSAALPAWDTRGVTRDLGLDYELDAAGSVEFQQAETFDAASQPGISGHAAASAGEDESLTHAQPEEDQQDLGADDRDGADGFGGPDLLDDEPLDAAPLETPDEQALWNEVSETSELAEPENAETPLPNGEGVLVHTDEEIEELERQYAARRAVEAAE